MVHREVSPIASSKSFCKLGLDSLLTITPQCAQATHSVTSWQMGSAPWASVVFHIPPSGSAPGAPGVTPHRPLHLQPSKPPAEAWQMQVLLMLWVCFSRKPLKTAELLHFSRENCFKAFTTWLNSSTFTSLHLSNHVPVPTARLSHRQPLWWELNFNRSKNSDVTPPPMSFPFSSLLVRAAQQDREQGHSTKNLQLGMPQRWRPVTHEGKESLLSAVVW